MSEAAPAGTIGEQDLAALQWNWGEAYLIGCDEEHGWWAAAERSLHQFRRFHRAGEPPALGPVGGEHGVDGVRRERLDEFRPGDAVSLPQALEGSAQGVDRDHGQSQRIPAERRVYAHVLPGGQRAAADTFAIRLREARGA